MATEKNPLENGLERYVGLEHLDSSALQIKRWGMVGEGTSFTKKFEKGQILFGKRRVYQHKAALADFDGLCSGDILVFDVINGDLISELLPFLVQSDKFFDCAVETSAGSLSPRTKWKELKKYEFPLPPLDEQRRMADLLWALEDAIRKKDEFAQAAKRYKKVLMRFLFTKGPIGIERENNQNLIDSEYGSIPTNWKLVSMGHIVEFKNGLNKGKEDFGFGTKFVNISDTYTERLNIDNLGMVNVSQSEISTYSLIPGDIVIVRSSVKLEGVGYPTLFTGADESVVFGGFTIRLRPDLYSVMPEYLLKFMKWDIFRIKLFSRATITTNTNVNQQSISKLKIILPPLPEQRKIAEILSKLDRNIEGFEAHKLRLQNLKKRLLNDLLTGKRRLGGV